MRGTWGLTKLPRGPQSHRPLCSEQPTQPHTEASDISPDANRCSTLQERKLRPRAAGLFAHGPTEMRAGTPQPTLILLHKPHPSPRCQEEMWPGGAASAHNSTRRCSPGLSWSTGSHPTPCIFPGTEAKPPTKPDTSGLISAGSVKGRRTQKGRG